MLDSIKEETSKPNEDETKQNLVTDDKKAEESTDSVDATTQQNPQDEDTPMNGQGDAIQESSVKEEVSLEADKSSGEEEKTGGEKPEEAMATEDAMATEEAMDVDKDDDKQAKSDTTIDENKPSTETKPPVAAAAAAPPPPVLKGTLSYNMELRRHLIRGMWNYENSSAFPHQRFELLRNLDAGEDPKEMPKDGEFHGSFSLAYFHTTSKGKQKERSKVIPEHGVKIKFTKIEGEEGNFKMDGVGTNQFGIFHINGTAKPSPHDDGQYMIVLRKRYEPSTAVAPVNGDAGGKKKRKAEGDVAVDAGPLPPPSTSYEKNVVCLRGKVYKEESEELGLGEFVHRIHGMWSSGLDLILADPQNVKGLCNRFEYEHKSSGSSSTFPVSGKYTGWFDLNQEDGSKAKIVEKDVTLKFRKNSAGYFNVDGRGSNYFGKYTITGTLTNDNTITIFRHFKPLKLKGPSRPLTAAPPPINAPGQTRRPSLPVTPEPQLKIDEVKVPEGEEPVEALKPPELPSYSAVSRGVLRLNEDGSQTCQGKWAVTREHFTNGQTSNFTFRLEAHFAKEALAKSDDRQFPLDSEMYKGSFQLKKGGSRYQTVIDQQIVMKFKKNTAGAYNVYGKGVNAIGVFNLTGTLIMRGKSSGQIEVYRMYPPELLASTQAPVKTASASHSRSSGGQSGSSRSQKASGSSVAVPPPSALSRRESTRTVKVPSRLEDDDPEAQLSRIMDKCNQILRFIREKDVERGAFFSEPVDPVALGIPTYRQVVTEPMDLRTLHRKMETNEVSTPEEFGRLARLVFENAMTFNVDPTHSVHQAARNLLIVFNQKYRDVERLLGTLRRSEKSTDERKKGSEKKRKKAVEEVKTLKQRRLDEAKEMAAANASALSAVVAAAPSSASANVTRREFNLMLQMIKDLQQQVVQTYTILAHTMPDTVESGPSASVYDVGAGVGGGVADYYQPIPERKRPAKKRPEPKIVERSYEEDLRPLTLEEQERLTENINDLPADHLHGVIQIIREAANLTGDEDEIDLEIDQLDTGTQRKLLRYVSKFVKQPKRQKGKATKKRGAAAQSRRNENPPPAKKTKTAAKPKADPNSLFAFGGKDDSDTDSDGEDNTPISTPAFASAKQMAPAASDDNFHLDDGFGAEDDSDDDDNNGDSGGNGAATSWNIAKPATENKDEGSDDDDDWDAAQKEAIASKAREEDKRKREMKMQAEAEQAKKERLAEAVERGEELKRQREAEEEVEARQREEEEKKKSNEARAAIMAEANSVEDTADLGDYQRNIVKLYEENFEKDLAGSASPSSDFGF